MDPGGTITTFAGNGTRGFSGYGGPATAAQLSNPNGIAVDPAGSLLVADSNIQRIRRVSATTGVIATIAGTGENAYGGDGGPPAGARFDMLRSVTVDSAGALYATDRTAHRIRRVW